MRESVDQDLESLGARSEACAEPAIVGLSSESTHAPVEGLNVLAFEKRLASLPEQGSGYCARGVRQSLNALFGQGPANGPNAKDYSEKYLSHWRTKDSCFKQQSGSLQPPKDFDIKVMPPSRGNSNAYGHIEIFYKGRWYSDFQQKSSLYGRHYSNPRTYRLNSCSDQKAHLHPRSLRDQVIFAAVNFTSKALSYLIEDARASEGPDSKPQPPHELSRVSIKQGAVDWRLIDRTRNQGTVFILEKVAEGKTQQVDSDTNSAFVLLEKNQRKLGAVAKKLAAAYVADWIAQEGKSSVQAIVDEQFEITPLQREAYLKNGLKPHQSNRTLKK